ncbi:flagellar hook protein FlgE [Azorhizobium oxalatiphilum]|uniref:Flagellar hook protein FlgE n=1 Tax=Azorhizobium oxalatiphilum TaxID=980631 RepID=A0A917F4P9_9HYPH|nr:flagellar hook protein FlgE [Azorhizobium oxalatiphilum]GGF47891.1 flagellar hook protein FlgE [Azorhizobium oxalatiphilum]
MSLYGSLRTAVSGMNAQSNKLSAISDNIANSSTSGYKAASTQFSTLIVDGSVSEYNSGGVNTTIRYEISTQGTTTSTSSNTDLMVSGDGFFLVQNDAGEVFLTRAGNFQVDANTGNLVNAAGYTLLAYDISGGQDPQSVVNGTANLVPVNIGNIALAAMPTSSGSITANLPSNTEVTTGDTPADNSNTSTYDYKSSVSTYDNLGNEVILDVYYTKTADAVAADPSAVPPVVASDATWEMTIYNQADRTSSTSPFPYSSAALSSQSVTFGSTGTISSTPTATFTVPNGGAVTVNLSGMTSLSTDYSMTAPMNGNAPSAASDVKVNSDGTVYAVDGSGNTINLYKVPLATVQSPDNLTPVSGNAYQVNLNSGALQVGFAGDPGYGAIKSNSLEASTVDIASELTEMIVAQRDYTANSKVFQTGTELLDVLMNLKR